MDFGIFIPPLALRDAGYSHVAFHSGYGHPEVLKDWIEVIEGL